MRLLRQIGVALAFVALSATAAIPQGVPSQRIGDRPANDNSSFGANTAYVDSALRNRAQRLFRFDPRVYGASCDGSGAGDDTGIANALNALKIAGGGALIIVGQCVISSPKVISGVPVAVMGDGLTVSQIIGSSTFPGGFLLRLDISTGSAQTATVSGVSFRTAQAEGANALQIEGSASGLEERVSIQDVEIRGVNLGTNGFATGLQLKNTNGPKVSRVTVTGRQSGNGPSGLTHMAACFDIPNTIGGPGGSAQTNYNFSDTRCNAAQRGWNINGYIEGVFCTRCLAVAVGTAIFARPGQIVPLLNVAQSHFDFFDAGVDVQQFAQGSYIGNLLYHRSDATGPGVCYQMANNSKENQIIGGECVNASTTTALVGVNWDNSSNNIVSDVVLSNLNSGIINQNGSTGNVYRRGQWINVPSGAGEFGNGGSTTNVCIGYGGLC